MFAKHVGLMIAAVLLAGCWTKRQAEVVSGGEVVATRIEAQTGGALPAGADLAVRIDSTLSAAKTKVGDRFTATVSTSVLAQNGDVVVPQGARIYGRITAIDDSDDPTDQALVQIDIESIEFRGKSYPLEASIIDVAEPGAIVKGGAFGAAAGTIISLGLGDVEHAIPAGTHMMLRTTETVSFR